MSKNPIVLQKFPFKNYDLDSLQLLGAGSYGKVYKCKNLQTGEFVAIKQISLQKIRRENLIDALKQQTKLMAELKSPYTVCLIQSNFGQQFAYLVMQLCDYDLKKKINQSPNHRMNQQQAIKIFFGIMNGFKVLVDNSYIHRDIKPENILIKGDQVKIGDFGFARKVDLLCFVKYQQFCGTPIYMAPQLLAGQPYTSKCDIWSLGMLLYEMVYGATPWPCRCVQTYERSIRSRPLSFPFDVKVGKQIKDFLKRSLQIQEQKRMNWQQVFSHPVIKDKIVGEVCLTRQVQPKLRLILAKMQMEAQRKFINQLQIFKKYDQFEHLTYQKFESLLKQLNPTVTSYQINVLFQACDNNSNKIIQKKQFQDLFCNFDYKFDPQTERQIDQIVGIITFKKIDLNQLFSKFDTNKTKALDYNEFKNMIFSLAPSYKSSQMAKLLKRFDKNNTGLIQFTQFLSQIGSGLANQKDYTNFLRQKAQRNLKMFKIHLNSKKLTPDSVMKMSDLNLDSHIDVAQLSKLMAKLNYKISQQQIKQIFKLLDANKSDKISINQLILYMS